MCVENPFIKKNKDEIRKLLGTVDTSANRFRKDKSLLSNSEDSERGLGVLDTWKKPVEKPQDLFAKTIAKHKPGRKSAADKNKEQQPNKDKKVLFYYEEGFWLNLFLCSKFFVNSFHHRNKLR